MEYKLLYHLVRNVIDSCRTRRCSTVSGVATMAPPSHYLRVFISRLRGKIERPGGPRYIQTERGRGYRFVRPTEQAPPQR